MQNNITEKTTPPSRNRRLYLKSYIRRRGCANICTRTYVFVYIYLYMHESVFLHWVPTFRQNYTPVIEGIIKESICREEMSVLQTSVI